VRTAEVYHAGHNTADRFAWCGDHPNFWRLKQEPKSQTWKVTDLKPAETHAGLWVIAFENETVGYGLYTTQESCQAAIDELVAQALEEKR